MEIELGFDTADTEKLRNDMRTIVRRFSREEFKKLIRGVARTTIIPALRDAAPVGSKIHYTYSTPGTRRAPKGQGRVRGTYHPGNLRASINTIDNASTRLREGVVIGPRVSRSREGVFGKSRPSGYYGHIVDKRKPFWKAAATAAIPAFLSKVTVEINKKIQAPT